MIVVLTRDDSSTGHRGDSSTGHRDDSSTIPICDSGTGYMGDSVTGHKHVIVFWTVLLSPLGSVLQ